MATMSAARFRSLYRRRKQAYEAAYHSSSNSVRQVGTGFSATQATETSPAASADERFRAAVRPPASRRPVASGLWFDGRLGGCAGRRFMK